MKRNVRERNFLHQGLKYTPFLPQPWNGKLALLVLFSLFMAVTSYQLTNSGLWFDEAVEYLVSIMPFDKMIPAINGTKQPPLYNFIMHFLLQVSVSEQWFRFTSVFFGLLGCAGLYAAVNEVSGWRAGAVSIFFYTFLYRSVYYNQECAEYSLAIAFLFWVVYFFVCLLRRFAWRKTIGFAVFCALAIYSHYGSIFLLMGCAICLLASCCIYRNWKGLRKLLVSTGTTVVIFGIPLYIFFAEKQIASSGGYGTEFTGILDEIVMFVQGLKENLPVLFGSDSADAFLGLWVEAVCVVLICFWIWGVAQKKNRVVRFLGAAAGMTYVFYNILVRLDMYGVGRFGRRYTMPLLPILLVSICAGAHRLLQTVYLKIGKKSIVFAKIISLVLLFVLGFHNYWGWTEIEKNWVKQDLRGTLEMWKDLTNGGEEDIYVYYAAIPAFVFYAENTDMDYGAENMDEWGYFRGTIRADVHNYKNIQYGERLRHASMKAKRTSLAASFRGEEPDHFWFLASHVRADVAEYMEIFHEMGYAYQIHRWDDERLLHLVNNRYIRNKYRKISGKTELVEILDGYFNLNMGITAEQDILFVRADEDPRFFMKVQEMEDFDASKKYAIILELFAAQAGGIELFYLEENDKAFEDDKSVEISYLAGTNRILVELPEGARPDEFRLNLLLRANNYRITFSEFTILRCW